MTDPSTDDVKEALRRSATDERLKELKHKINHAHEKASTAAHSAITHAIEAGRLLREAKERLGHGDWGTWRKLNFKGSGRTAQAYMRLAKHRNRLLSNAQSTAHLTIDGALCFLRTTTRTEPRQAARDVAVSIPASAVAEGATESQQPADRRGRGSQAEAQAADLTRSDTPPPGAPTAAVRMAAGDELSDLSRWLTDLREAFDQVAEALDAAIDTDLEKNEIGLRDLAAKLAELHRVIASMPTTLARALTMCRH